MSERAHHNQRRGRKNGSARGGAEGPLARLGRPLTLITYGDKAGRVHRVTLRGHLVLDECRAPRELRVVCELGEGEGRPEGEACLHEGGYLDRARAQRTPPARKLVAADLPGVDAREHGDRRAV